MDLRVSEATARKLMSVQMMINSRVLSILAVMIYKPQTDELLHAHPSV